MIIPPKQLHNIPVMQRHILSHAIGKIKRPKKFLQMQWEFLIMDKCGPQGTGKGNGMKTSTLDTHLGKIAIGTDVIAQYAGAVAMECFGIVGMANVNVRDGLVNLLKSDNIKKIYDLAHGFVNGLGSQVVRDECEYGKYSKGCSGGCGKNDTSNSEKSKSRRTEGCAGKPAPRDRTCTGRNPSALGRVPS